ncbi:kinetochore protein NUF2, putative [Babesia caballi]|uniref:Kinetochore protein NUF2, putative n=1 Tax=Babesia caballi TaxID=5871 RepID=A0AAV4LUI6_BABCB|nr:kinetochore protein NUF2, putative [Babesia caballi]
MDIADEQQVTDELFRKVRFDEILEDLKELGVDVREQTLKNPTPEEALGLYGLAIQVIFGKTRTDIRPEDVYCQIHVYSSEVEGLRITADNLGFLKRGIGNLRFWRYCQRLHETLGLPDIERYELFSPTPESFHRFVSAFVVYLRFLQALRVLFESELADLNFRAEQEVQLDDNIRQVQQELQNFKRLREENALDISTSLGDKARLEQLLLDAKRVFNTHKEEKATIDGEVERAKVAINDVQLKRTKARHRSETLGEQVVSEPEALYVQKDELEAQEASQAAVLRTLADKFDQVAQRVQCLEACNEFMVDVRANLVQHLDEVLRPLVENSHAGTTLRVRNETLREQIVQQKAKRDEARGSLECARQSQEEKLRVAQEAADGRLKVARKFADDTQAQALQLQELASQEGRKVESLAEELARREGNVAAVVRSVEAGLKRVADARDCYGQAMDELVQQLLSTVADD